MPKRERDPLSEIDNAALRASLNPYTTYVIHSANVKFTGAIGADAGEMVFLRGFSRLVALPEDADEDDVEDRNNSLDYLANAHPVRKRKWRLSETTGEPEPYYEIVPAYTWEEETATRTTRSKRKAEEEREEEPAVA